MVIIIGGGISGLATAYNLQKAGVPHLVLEATDRPGGIIQSVREGNCLLESGPNSLLIDTYAENLLHDLGLKNEIIPASPANGNRYILKDGKYKKLPSGPLSLLLGNFFSFSTKVKILKEFFRKPGLTNTSTLQEFFISHFNTEIADYALNPFVSGIYAGDPRQLLVEETFPSLKKYERENGSVLKGIIKNAGARKKTISFREGMHALPARISSLVNIEYGAKVQTIKEKEGAGFEIEFINAASKRIAIKADYVVLSVPAYIAAEIIKPMFPQLAALLSSVNYPPMSVTHTIYKKVQFKNLPNGFGGLNPSVEHTFSSGSIWNSALFAGRCNSEHALFTTFVGGMLNKENAMLPDEQIKNNVHLELKKYFQIKGHPLQQSILRWTQSIPQYDAAIIPVKQALMNIANNKFYVCANWMNGVSVIDCLKNGVLTAKKIETQLKS